MSWKNNAIWWSVAGPNVAELWKLLAAWTGVLIGRRKRFLLFYTPITIGGMPSTKIYPRRHKDKLLLWISLLAEAGNSLGEGDESCSGPSGKLLCLRQNKKLQHMYGNIPYLFDFWADPSLLLMLANNLCTLIGWSSSRDFKWPIRLLQFKSCQRDT